MKNKNVTVRNTFKLQYYVRVHFIFELIFYFICHAMSSCDTGFKTFAHVAVNAKHVLTNSMAYGTWRFSAGFTRALQ